MNVTEFRSKIQPNQTLLIGDKELTVKEVIKFRFSDGDFYIKCFLNDGYVLADDLDENMFILVKGVDTPFKEPFPKQLEYDSKQFKFEYQAEAVAEEVSGEEVIPKGYKEKFWDYQSETGEYLSLGVDESGKRMDFYGKIITGLEISN